MIYNLKLFDYSLMKFSLSRDIDGILNCHIISVNEKRKNLLPLGLKIEDSA